MMASEARATLLLSTRDDVRDVTLPTRRRVLIRPTDDNLCVGVIRIGIDIIARSAAAMRRRRARRARRSQTK